MSVEIRVPAMGESIIEATISRWFKKAGDAVSAGDVLVELETDKINQELVSEHNGTIEKILHNEGDTVTVNEVIALINESASPQAGKSLDAGHAETSNTNTPAEQPAVPVSAAVAHDGNAIENGKSKSSATPLAQKIAAENKLDLAKITGSGVGGKVTKEDVETFARKPDTLAPVPISAAVLQAPSTPVASVTKPQSAGPRSEERRRMSRRRQTIAARLVEAQRTAAMLTTFNEADMSVVMDIRKRRKDSFKERNGVNLGFMSFFTKAAIGALKAFPLLNAEIQGDEIVVKHYYDIGIAVGAEEGLVVPVLRDADQKSFEEIEREIVSLATKARENKLALADLQGGTFTITNGGVFGSLMSTPILNTPQVGILGLHKIQERPVVIDGQIVIRPMMYLALSYDHRIVDGSEAVKFLVKLKELIEDPMSLILEA